MTGRGRRTLLVLAGGGFALLLVTALLLYQNPFWLVERVTDLYLWRHGVHQRNIAVNNHTIHYLEAPSQRPGSDKPIVLIHGLGARASDWAVLTPTLAAHGYHVYALDLLGYGKSDKPMGGDFSLASEERVVAGFIDALHLRKTDVAGWSMGGWIAAKYALDEPGKVRRLLLFDSAGLYMPVEFPLSIFAPSSKADLDALLYRIEPDKPHIRIPSIAVAGLLHRFQQNAHIVNSSLASMLDGREILDFRLGLLKMPVLLVWGTEDKLTPIASAERMHQLIPQSILVRLHGCGHLAIAECASAGVPITLKFLDAEPPMPSMEYSVQAEGQPQSTPSAFHR